MQSTDSTQLPLRKGDWIRFQLKSNRIVLEGFVQQIAPDGKQIRVGHAPAPLEETWYSLEDIHILHHQTR